MFTVCFHADGETNCHTAVTDLQTRGAELVAPGAALSLCRQPHDYQKHKWWHHRSACQLSRGTLLYCDG